MTQLSREIRTARKPHQCDACLGDIVAGERYHTGTNIQDGHHSRWKNHVCCDEAASARQGDPDYSDGFPWGWIREELSHGGEDFAPELRARLFAAAAAVGGGK